ncbi:embryo defective 2759 [Tasmannia lanceolata]|uniref:embryo defective 2759 n=1 Tax=Tasmannia lanceolata TaxID=3420 RepID=UPI004064B708
MALITQQMQGSYATFKLRPLPCTRRVKLRSFVPSQLIGRTDRCTTLKHRLRLSVGGQPIISPQRKPFKISSFKGNAQNHESEGRTSSSKFSKNSSQLSYVPQEREETTEESSDLQKIPLSYTSEESEETITGSPAIQKLFKKWLIMLRTQTLNPTTDGIFEEIPPLSKISESQQGTPQLEVGKLLKAALVYFLGLDAAIKLPLLIFIPWYLAINAVYGAEVSKELMPMWVLGPLIIAFYVKLVQGLCSLYVFCFKQTIKLVKDLPKYILLIYNYIAEGKLREYVQALFWQPVVDIRNLDYKEMSKRKLKELEEWAVEKYLDYVESIWPYYCRTIRFLKKANLI